MPEWALQFPIEKTRSYAARFPSDNDDAVIAIGSAARDRGHYLRDEFISVCKWKSERSRSYAAKNTARAVKAATRVALSEASTERDRVKALRSLNGIDRATASVLLHLAYPERYPILDQRALQAFGVVVPRSSYSYRFWEAYLDAWRPLLAQAGVDGRTFDQALWQWSKEEGAPLP
jgi:hypothetical protein